MSQDNASSHKQILKATSIVGGSQVLSILIQIVRTKIIAVWLGPAGVGAIGLYQSTLGIVGTATGLGLGFSAVRDVAEAAGTGDQQRIGRTITILRRWVWLTGLLGMALLLFFREEFSLYAFKDTGHAFDFMILAIVPLFAALSGGQMAILQGVRRVGDMARAGILGTAAGLCITVPLYWLLGVQGIVPALVLAALAELVLSWYFARRIGMVPVKVTVRETATGGIGMIRLGLFTVLTGLLTTGTMYLLRIFISTKMGVDGVGQFQAAWSLSSTYAGLVLGAMGADYFPRLSAVHHDNEQVCRLVNEQTEIALLLAGPLIVGMTCFMDLIVTLFYSAKFGQSIDILLWQTIGNLLKVIAWPMGFVLLAKSKGGWLIFTELLWNMLLFGATQLGWNRMGLESAGFAFLISYCVCLFALFFICKRICGFAWSNKNIKLIVIYVTLATLSFCVIRYQFVPFWRVINIVFFVLAIICSYQGLKKVISYKEIICFLSQKFIKKTQGDC